MRYTLARLLRAIGTLWLAVTLVFVGLRLSGDPAAALFGLRVPEHVQGRVLHEVLEGVPGEPPQHQRELVTPPAPASDGDPVLVRERVGSTTYVHLVDSAPRD